MKYEALIQMHRRTGRTYRMVDAALAHWKSGLNTVIIVHRSTDVPFISTMLYQRGYVQPEDGPVIDVFVPPTQILKSFILDQMPPPPNRFIDHHLLEEHIKPWIAEIERWMEPVDPDRCRTAFEARKKYNATLTFCRGDDGNYRDDGIQRDWELWQESWNAALGTHS